MLLTVTWYGRRGLEGACYSGTLSSGRTVYLARPSYEELVTRAESQYLGGHYREIIKDLRIQIAPAGPMEARVNFLADNIQHVAKPGQPGQLREYDRKNDPMKPGDAFVAAQTVAVDGLLLTADTKLRNRAKNLNVKIAPESYTIKGVSGVEDPVKARQLLGLNPKAIQPDGSLRVNPTTGGVAGAYIITRPGGVAKHVGGSDGPSGAKSTGLKASLGVANNSLPQIAGPPPRGTAAVGGIRLLFEGVNFVLNTLIEREQKDRVTNALTRIQPAINKQRTENPYFGVLLLLYYTQIVAPSESIMQPAAVFQYIKWGCGASPDEAREDALREATISADTTANVRKFSQEVWVPPLQKSSVTAARARFPPIAFGRFALSKDNRAMFQLVDFNVVGGFDDVFEKSLELPKSSNVEFVILNPPTSVSWNNIKGVQQVGVPLKSLKSANGHAIPAVDLDPYSPFHAAAAMCFPLNEWSQHVFGIVEDTRGTRILHLTNFGMVRWIRPANIEVLEYPDAV